MSQLSKQYSLLQVMGMKSEQVVHDQSKRYLLQKTSTIDKNYFMPDKHFVYDQARNQKVLVPKNYENFLAYSIEQEESKTANNITVEPSALTSKQASVAKEQTEREVWMKLQSKRELNQFKSQQPYTIKPSGEASKRIEYSGKADLRVKSSNTRSVVGTPSTLLQKPYDCNCRLKHCYRMHSAVNRSLRHKDMASKQLLKDLTQKKEFQQNINKLCSLLPKDFPSNYRGLIHEKKEFLDGRVNLKSKLMQGQTIKFLKDQNTKIQTAPPPVTLWKYK